MALVLLALWMPVTLHCVLERLPGLHWLECCCAAASDAQTPSNCERQPCGSLEGGAVKIEQKVLSAPPPPLSPRLPALTLTAVLLPVPMVATGQFSPAPPELAPCWRFNCRTAWPPRAPSLVS